MYSIEQISEELAEHNVPDEVVGKIENFVANLNAEKEKAIAERDKLSNELSWIKNPENMGR